jgi:hypothetical protein
MTATNYVTHLIRLIVVSIVLTGSFSVDAKETFQPSSPAADVKTSESDLTTHGHYINKDGQAVHSPSKSKSGKVPDGASAQCRDGSYSFSQHHSGTCSRHGGVARWL